MLSPFRVLDLTTERGLLCGQILGDLGADVIKVEPPGGSRARRIGPFYENVCHPDRSIYWWAYNRNKRSITLNIETSQGQEILRRLITGAHFLIESNDPGHLAKRALGYEDLSVLNPALVCVSITPFGQDGPKARYADSDLVILAAGGALYLNGDEDRPPVRIGVPQAYLHAAADAAMGALIAHRERQRSGRGQHVDVSAQQSVAQAAQSAVLDAPLGAPERRRAAGGFKIDSVMHKLVWPARDGYVAISFLFGSSVGPFTRRLMEVVCEEGFCDEATRDKDWISYQGLLSSGQEPVEELERVKAAVESFTRSKSKSELLQIAVERRLLISPIAAINEVAESDQLASRNYWRNLKPDPTTARSIRFPGPFVRFGNTAITYRRAPPSVGEHNHEIYVGELGLNETTLVEFQQAGVI
jgi:crotonobetainyl-CoA:carnitine CoA-transferase CaiB-like acyl-CoA transferase